MSPKEITQILKEISVMKKANEFAHPNVLQLIGICSKPICIVTEYCENGNLREFLLQPIPISHNYLKTALICIARGMSYLHQLEIVHRDLSCRNILLAKQFVPKIADFGLSKGKFFNLVYPSDGDQTFESNEFFFE